MPPLPVKLVINAPAKKFELHHSDGRVERFETHDELRAANRAAIRAHLAQHGPGKLPAPFRRGGRT